ncbi:MAG: hypothetical protein DRG30_06145 [Epsilonproteobacteria bacterium]|nr:MAG: hypothetical protein DRG30_06145 [Campylobacterota bacterium]
MISTDVQGTKTYVLDVPSTAWADCTEAIAAIKAGTEALCPQTLGDLARTREITDYGCISSNDSTKSAGKLTYSDYTIELLFDMTDTDGQKGLYDAMENNTPIILAMESSNMITPLTGNGDIIWTEAIVSGDTISYPVNGKIGYSVTISPYGGYLRCDAT